MTLMEMPVCVRFREYNSYDVHHGQISRFSIDFRRHPYNTLALPCQCVMCWSCGAHSGY